MTDTEWTKQIESQRRTVRWSRLSNEDLKRALDRHALWETRHEVDIQIEIQRRIIAGEWLDVDKPPSPTVTLTRFGKFLSRVGLLRMGQGS